MPLVSVVLGATALWASLPARVPLTVDVASGWPPSVRGAVHVHSTRSDGSGTADDIAAAAARAGLDFVILTDHGDGIREPDPPAYRSGVLVLDAVEVSTGDGHVVALGLEVTPYPLGGRARDVVEDVRRLGGLSIAAHPTSATAELRWTDWDTPVDGLEWNNGDSEWRDEGLAMLGRALLSYPLGPSRALALLLDRPVDALREWNAAGATRRVFAVAAADAHARLAPRDAAAGGASLPLPSYDAVFGLFSNTVTPLTFTKNAAVDGRALLDAIREGHLYSTIDALAAYARFTFTATAGAQRVTTGDILAPGEPVHLVVDSNAPVGARTTIFRNGAALESETAPRVEVDAGGEPAVYRAEIDLPGAPGQPPVPWLVSNTITVGMPGLADNQPPPPAAAIDPSLAWYPAALRAGWTVETSPRSKAEVEELRTPRGRQLALRWALGGTRSESPFAALVLPVGAALRGATRLGITVRASTPMRLSVQLRGASGEGEVRWRRSVYLDSEARALVIPLQEFSAAPGTAGDQPALDAVRDLIFAVDTTNTAPGARGQVWIETVHPAK